MEDTDERRRQRERLVAYFIGGLVREYGINLSNQPGPMARLRHFAQVGQTGLEDGRLDALTVNDRQISTGLNGEPLAFQVNIEKKMLRAILDGAIPPPTDDAASAAARAKRFELERIKRAAEVEARRRIESRADDSEEKERDARALRRFKMIMLLSTVAVFLAIAAIAFFKSRDHDEHGRKSEGAHANH